MRQINFLIEKIVSSMMTTLCNFFKYLFILIHICRTIYRRVQILGIAINWEMAVINVIMRSLNGFSRHYACDFARRSQRGGILITALFEKRWRSGESVAIERFHVVEINRAIHRLMGLSDRERWRIW